MKRVFLAMFLLILFSGQNCFIASAEELSGQNKEKVILIKKVKEFENTIGLNKTDNFTKFKNKDQRLRVQIILWNVTMR